MPVGGCVPIRADGSGCMVEPRDALLHERLLQYSETPSPESARKNGPR
jgi:hypothetical protein